MQHNIDKSSTNINPVVKNLKGSLLVNADGKLKVWTLVTMATYLTFGVAALASSIGYQVGKNDQQILDQQLYIQELETKNYNLQLQEYSPTINIKWQIDSTYKSR